MKAAKTFLIASILIILLGGAYLYYSKYNEEPLPTFINKHTRNKKYIIKKAGKVIEYADTLEEAIKKAEENKRSIVINTYNNEWVYTDLKPFMVITDNAIHDFKSFEEALDYVKNNKYKDIYYKNDKNKIWTTNIELTKKEPLNVPLIKQYPELPRGCEVTSLGMILNYRNINVNKMTLAKEVKKDTTQYSVQPDGKIRYGNPYDGFVGDMYNWDNNGYGVYHGPIVELAKSYAGEAAIDLTGLTFEEILYAVELGNPVWVITNATFSPLRDSEFKIWHTPTGIVKVTSRLHSVVITGFNEEKVYINDPLKDKKNITINRESFKRAWEQMGNQAITILG